MTRRASICALVDNPGEVEMAESWLEKNSAHLGFVSEMNGCGCCVFLWDVEGPDAIVRTIPPQLVAASD
ncbi:hypothetical protein LJR066_005695 [Acidovorax sp. LjRoot66]|uniref:hypothetical protein n=1 Tax=Acidovorax sp. LjRoot66 TaxID=3342334 RepID=UPI003ECFBE2B